MAETTPQQQQYPDLSPYASTNGNGSVEEKKNTILSSKVGAIHNTPLAPFISHKLVIAV